MPATLDEVKQLISTAFPGADVDQIGETPDHRIVGSFIWPEFAEYDDITRNRLVTQKVRDKLGLKGLNVGVLIPLVEGEQA